MSFNSRLIYLLSSWLPAGIIYAVTSLATNPVWLVPNTKIDDLIAFDAGGIWLYLMFYVYIPFAFLVSDKSSLPPMRFAFIGSAVVSGIVFVFFPSTMSYPDVELTGLSADVLNFVVHADTPNNCFPSLHGSLLAICTLALLKLNKKSKTLILVFCFAMYFAILQIKRHVFIDLLAGILLGTTFYLLGYVFYKYRKKEEAV